MQDIFPLENVFHPQTAANAASALQTFFNLTPATE